MDYKLYVGNLPYSTTEDELGQLFSQSGTVVSVDLIKDRLTKRSKGYAFIEMSSLLEAEKAIELFNGRSLDDNEIRVSFARRSEGLIANKERRSLRLLKGGRNKRH